MLRRPVLHILLSLLLLISQQLSVLHVVSHLSTPREVAVAQADSSSALSKAIAQDQSCDQCLAFAQLAGAVGSDERRFVPASQVADHAATCAIDAACARPLRAFQSRAPPVFA